MDYVELIIAVLGTGTVTTLISYVLFRRKHEAEANEKETGNEIKLYETLQKRNKDQDEMIELLSGTLKTTQKDLMRIDLSFHKESLNLKKQIEEKNLALSDLQSNYKLQVQSIEEQLGNLEAKIVELEKENHKLKLENERLKSKKDN